MKRRTTPILKVSLNYSNTLISTIDFIFKQVRSEEAATLLEKQYPTNVTYDSTQDCYLIPFTEAQTALFAAGKEFYMDTKITTTTNKIPATSIVALHMHDTLFNEEEEE